MNFSISEVTALFFVGILIGCALGVALTYVPSPYLDEEPLLSPTCKEMGYDEEGKEWISINRLASDSEELYKECAKYVLKDPYAQNYELVNEFVKVKG